MHTVTQPGLTTTSPPQPSAAQIALCRWFPWCNTRVAQAIRIVRPHYPLIKGGRPEASRVGRAPDGGLAA